MKLPDSAFRPRRLAGRAWRVVEGQHVVSTRRLVDTTEEQAILEDLIESSKPALPGEASLRGLHYLLTTPFRYPPLRHGSRFGTRTEPSLWYGSTTRRTAFAETAYYRLLFLDGTAADLGTVTVELSAFRIALRSARALDLSRAPFDRLRERIASPDSYAFSQRLGAEMRSRGVRMFRYPSARDVERGINIGLFDTSPFIADRPDVPETWHCVTTSDRVELVKRDFFEKRSLAFSRSEFEVEGKLPAPAP